MNKAEINQLHGYLNKLYNLLKSGSKINFCRQSAKKFNSITEVSANRLTHWFTDVNSLPKDKYIVKEFFQMAFNWLDCELKVQYSPERSRIQAIDLTTQMIKEKLQ